MGGVRFASCLFGRDVICERSVRRNSKFIIKKFKINH